MLAWCYSHSEETDGPWLRSVEIPSYGVKIQVSSYIPQPMQAQRERVDEVIKVMLDTKILTVAQCEAMYINEERDGEWLNIDIFTGGKTIRVATIHNIILIN
jgi:hypothetical protein